MLAPWKKSYDQPGQHIKKQRHYFADKGPSIQSYGFSSSHVWMWELDHKESWALKNWCFWTVVLEKTLERPLDCKEIQPVCPKGNQSWIFTGKTDAEAENSNTEVTWYKELTHWKRPWCWERLKAGGDRDNRGWDGRMASPTQWTWVWVNSGSWWWTGRPGVLQFVGSQRVRHDERLNWTVGDLPSLDLRFFIFEEKWLLLLLVSRLWVFRQPRTDLSHAKEAGSTLFLLSGWEPGCKTVSSPHHQCWWCKVLFSLPQLQSVYISCASLPAEQQLPT